MAKSKVMNEMLNVDLALGKLSALISASPRAQTVETDIVPIEQADGRIAAEPVVTGVDLPPFDASSMDGYAVLADETEAYRVIDEARAGHPSGTQVVSGTATRIFTGSAMPPGANAVVLQEDGERDGTTFTRRAPITAGENVRYRGNDIKKGESLATPGTRLTPLRLAWFAACGIQRVTVYRRVRVGIFSSGDELADAGTALAPGQIYDSNRFALRALMAHKAAKVTDLGRLPDDPAPIRAMLERASGQFDMIVTSGGVSVGDADYVRGVVEALGSLDFWRVALKPGKPLAVGRIDDALFFGLPGNPVSTIVTYLLFVAPAIDQLAGTPPVRPTPIPALLHGTVSHRAGRREYVRARLSRGDDGLRVVATGDQSSNRLSTFAEANALIVVPEDAGDLADGTPVDVLLLTGEASTLWP